MNEFKAFFKFLLDFKKLEKRITFRTFVFWFCMNFIIGGIIIGYSIEILENVGLMNELVETEFNFSYSLLVFTAVVVAPVLEETIFRYPLKFFRKSTYFRYIFYFLALVFAVMHYSSYVPDSRNFIFMPLVLAGPFWGALILGYIRIQYGFWWAVLLHSGFNGCCLVWESFV